MNTRVIVSLFTAIIAISANAAHYYVCPDVTNDVVYEYNGNSFVGGDTAFPSIAEALTHASTDDVINIQPGVYAEHLTITTPGITLLGNNAYCETRSQNRATLESSITGTITVNADRITVNGFRFTESGCVITSDQTPIHDFTFAFNTVEAATNEHPIVQISNTTGLTISNNVFNGTSNTPTEVVKMNSIGGQVEITGNTFNNISRGISIAESNDDINISHNTFQSVSVCAINLQRIGASSKTQIMICDNLFDGCTASANTYPVMLDQGKNGTHVTASAKSALMFNRNVIKNFTPYQYAEFNYFLWAEAADCSPFTVDTRFNRCDNSAVAFGTTPPQWETSSQRYFAGSTGVFDFEQASADYYRNPTGAQQHQYKLKTNAAAQSFDIDTETGDIYYIQTEGSGDGVLPLRVTRYLFRDDKTTGRQYMYLTNASHGANMSVFRHNGKVWIATGGASIFDGHCKPQSSVLLPFVSGATADCGDGKTSFTYNGKTYDIIQFRNQWNKNGCYPAIDVDNRLFCESHTAASGKVRFAVYDLDDVLANGSKAKLIKAVIIQKGSNKYRNTDGAYSDIVNMDEGFSTSGWAMQGFDISGDMIYRHEGVGRHNDLAYQIGGQAIPTIMQDCINWRDSVYVHRKPILHNAILAAPNGEPEGVKIVRDADGLPHILVGIVWGTPSQRSSTLVDFAPQSPKQGFSYTIPTAILNPVSVPSVFITSSIISQTKTAKIDTRNGIGITTGVVTGQDAACFKADYGERSGINVISDRINVTFTPDGKKRTYKATLRVSSPNAEDRLIPLTGSYSGKLSSVTDISTDQDANEIIGYYDINGRQIANPVKGITIVRYANGSAQKIIIP